MSAVGIVHSHASSSTLSFGQGAQAERLGYVERFAEKNECPPSELLCSQMRMLRDVTGIRPADHANLLLVAARVKPTCLVVCDEQLKALQLADAVESLRVPALRVAIHFDPLVNRFYVIACTSQDKATQLESLAVAESRSLSRHGTRLLCLMSSSKEYHLELGRFLDVPVCCLVDDAVMPHEADLRFADGNSAEGALRENPEIHFSSHLPCCAACKPSHRIGRVYEEKLRLYAPEVVRELEATRASKPLYLY